MRTGVWGCGGVGGIGVLLPLLARTGVFRAFCKGVECPIGGKCSIIKVVGRHDPGVIFKFY